MTTPDIGTLLTLLAESKREHAHCKGDPHLSRGRNVQRRPVASSARRNRRAARLPDASASGHNTTAPPPLNTPAYRD